jgi:hypothetical protein
VIERPLPAPGLSVSWSVSPVAGGPRVCAGGSVRVCGRAVVPSCPGRPFPPRRRELQPAQVSLATELFHDGWRLGAPPIANCSSSGCPPFSPASRSFCWPWSLRAADLECSTVLESSSQQGVLPLKPRSRSGASCQVALTQNQNQIYSLGQYKIRLMH